MCSLGRFVALRGGISWTYTGSAYVEKERAGMQSVVKVLRF